MNITKKSTPIGNIIRLDDVVLQSGNEEGFRELFRFYDKDIKKTDCDDSYIDYRKDFGWTYSDVTCSIN